MVFFRGIRIKGKRYNDVAIGVNFLPGFETADFFRKAGYQEIFQISISDKDVLRIIKFGYGGELFINFCTDIVHLAFCSKRIKKSVIRF